MEQAILDYIKQARDAAMGDEQIRQALVSSGWSEHDIQTAMNFGGGETPNPLTSSAVAPEGDQKSFINKWSWGGFLLYFVYFLGSRNYKRAFLYFFGNFVPILNIYLWIKSGHRGRKMVWESGKWLDFESYKKRQKLLDEIGFVIAGIVALILIATSVFGYFRRPNNVNTKSEVPSVSREANQAPPQTSAIYISDADQVKAILEEIRQGYLTGTKALIIKHASAKTFSFFSSGTLDSVSAFTVNGVSQSGPNIVANITTVSAGKSDTQDMVFIKEEGEWKFDLDATIQWSMNRSDAKKGTGNPTNSSLGGDESIDLAVQDIQITPNPPKAGDKNTDVEVRFKNLGPGTVRKCINYQWKWVIGDNHETGGGSNCSVLAPGQVALARVSPTGYFLSQNTSPGPRAIHFELNYDDAIKEIGKNNNILDQTIEFVP